MSATGQSASTDHSSASGPALFVLDTRKPDSTAALGARLAGLARPGDVFCLQGGLGSGKTVLARGFVQALAGAGVEVPSPTFNIVLTYPTAAAILWHFDLYRVADPDELWELGLDEAFADGISLVEWPERLDGNAPPQALWLELAAVDPAPDSAARAADLTDGGERRRITCRGDPAWRDRLRGAGLA